MNPWDKKFKTDMFVYGTEPNVFLEKNLAIFRPSASVACYAEGEGRNAVFLAENGHAVTAYDYSNEGLEKTKQLAKHKHVQVNTKLKNLIEETLEEGVYDGAVMIFGHFSKAHQYEVLDKIVGSLKVGGVFLMEVYEEAQLAYKTGGPQDIDFLYNEVELYNWAKKYETLHFVCSEVERYEGTGHAGACKVVQLIIKK